jgi:hypothetical protein
MPTTVPQYRLFVLDRHQLAIALVRQAEKYPHRKALEGWGRCDNHCIVGQIFHDAGACCEFVLVNYGDVPAVNLAKRAMFLNDSGAPWGQIPKLLGLVPGEQPIEAPVASLEAEGVLA